MALLLLFLVATVGALRIKPTSPVQLNSTVDASSSSAGRTSTQEGNQLFAVVWTSNSVDIKAQIFNRDSAKKSGQEIAVSVVPSGTSVDPRPIIAAWSDGFAVAWASQQSTRSVITCTLFSANGQRLVAPVAVSAGPWDSRPAMVALGGSQAVVVWQSQYDGTVAQPLNNIYGRLVSLATGQPLGTPFKITPTVNRQSHDAPAVAQLNDSLYVVVFALYSAVQPGDIYFVIYNGSTPIKLLTALARDSSELGFYFPSVSAVSTNSTAGAEYFAVAWSQYSGTVQWCFVNSGTWEASPVFTSQISTPQSTAEPHIVTVYNSSAVVLAWEAAGVAYFTSIASPASPAAGVTPLPATTKTYYPSVVQLDPRYLVFTGTVWSGHQDGVISLAKINQAPIIKQQLAVPPYRQDDMINFGFPAEYFSDADGDMLLFSSTLRDGSALPAWLHMDTLKGGVLFTGEYSKSTKLYIVLTVSDGWESVSSEFLLYVKAPVLTLASVDQFAVVFRRYALPLRELFTADSLQDSLSFQIDSSNGKATLPSWLTLFANGSLVGTPMDPNAAGTKLVLTVVATDGDGWSNFTTVTLTTRLNTLPIVAVPLAQQLPAARPRAGELFTFTLRADTFTDADGDHLCLSAFGSKVGTPLPDWMTFDPQSRTLLGTPGKEAGTVRIYVVADDGLGQASDWFDLSVDRPDHRLVTVTVIIVILVSLFLVVAAMAFVWHRHRLRVRRTVHLDDGQYSQTHSQSQGVTSAASSCVSEQPETLVSPRTVRASPSVPRIAHNIPIPIEDIEMQQFFETEYPDLIDPISGEIMRDPVVTAAGQSYDRRCLVKHLQLRCTDPLTNQQLDRDKPFEPNYTLKKHIDQLITKWKEDRAKSLKGRENSGTVEMPRLESAP
eukprot:TRINITY_DN30639_c0_g1_i1.p1 TRINITY_DN30639_c0_g1~~TRINITY_DN30639_c0_g1_i1.p1  ORF type:complete len:891 (+),score=87.29 TRINITY_DN30639_c0_g1_i1:38-2710(+)